MSENESKFELIIAESGLDKTKAQYLLDNFTEYFALAADWEKKAKAIIVTNEKQVAEMKMAREGRLFLKEKRIAVENTRKNLKEQSLREGKAIDGIANVLKALIVPIENYLDEQEHYAENKKKAEDAERQRIMLERIKAEDEAKKKAEDEARIAEQKRLTAENERLKEEKRKADLKAATEKMKRDREIAAERKAADERLASERAEAEKKAREAAERATVEAERIKADAEEKRKIAEKKYADERAEAEKKAKAEREELERRLAEEKEKLLQVVCPKCGHSFRRTE